MTRRTRLVAAAVAAAVTSLAAGLTTATAHDPVIGVVPASVAGDLAPGQSMTVAKTVHTIAIPPLVDIFLLEDETGSFADDIANLQTLAGPGGPLIVALDATGANYATGVGGFRDFAQSIWGSPGDWVYERYSDITLGGAGFVAGVPSLTAGGGNDDPEAQLEALHYLAVPGHAAIDSNGDGDTADANDTAVGLQPSWRVGAKRVVLLATDNACHVTGDPPPPGWPGDAGTTSAAATGAVLAGAQITVIGLTPGGAGFGCVDVLAAATGGTVQSTTTSGSDIVAAIMAGLGNLPVTVTHSATCDPGLSVALAPASRTVTSGEDALFTETITASPSAPQGSTIGCTVQFLVDGNPAGPAFTETIRIRIKDVTAPRVACAETNNPSGNNVPKAGPNAGSSGQNPDGFYLLSSTDNVDPTSTVSLTDSASGMTFGPWPSGTKIKLVQAPGATPGVKPGSGDIDWKVTINGDAIVTSTDAAGNVGMATCLVPPPPK
jgi:hypothetical protein